MSEAGRHVISADDILKGGPVESVLFSRTGLGGSKRLSVVAELDTGIVFYKVEVNGGHSGFPLTGLDKAVAFYNEH